MKFISYLSFLIVLSCTPLVYSAQINFNPDWEIRFAQIPDQAEQMKEQGVYPNFQVTIETENDLAKVRGNKKSNSRGYALLGKSFHVPNSIDDLPAALKNKFSIQNLYLS